MTTTTTTTTTTALLATPENAARAGEVRERGEGRHLECEHERVDVETARFIRQGPQHKAPRGAAQRKPAQVRRDRAPPAAPTTRTGPRRRSR